MPTNQPFDHNAQIAQLWTDHHEVLEHSVARWAGRSSSDHDVQDAVAATYERTLRYLYRGGTLEDPRGWLLTVARREFLRILDRQRGASELFDDEVSRTLIDPAPQPDEIVLDHTGRNLDGALDRALARLTPRERQVLTGLHAGYTYREIQRRRTLSFTALNKALTKARAKLRNDGALRRAYREWSS